MYYFTTLKNKHATLQLPLKMNESVHYNTHFKLYPWNESNTILSYKLQDSELFQNYSVAV